MVDALGSSNTRETNTTSTDARAGTPGLPGVKSPTARAMFVDQLVGNIAML